MLKRKKNNKITVIKEIVTGLLLLSCTFFTKAVEIKDLKECSPRNGLPNFFNKLNHGKEVKIAYFGGSITAQKGWRILSSKWFQDHYPKAKVEEIHAAIGGTGSGLGVFRLDRDVLSYTPDLVFIEFAVNDYRASPESIRKAFEGIIRKTWQELPECDICFVYTVTVRDDKCLRNGKMKRSASVMEDIASHYGIPSIHMGVEVANLLKAGKLQLKAKKEKMTHVSGDQLNKSAGVLVNKDGNIPFASDGVHPYTDTGHKLYMDAIARSVPVIEKAGKVGPHKIPAAMGPNWKEARMLPLSVAEFSKNGWIKLGDSSPIYRMFKERMPEVWKGEPGASLKFKFKGTRVAIYDIIGPGCGMVEVKIDGKTHKICRIDGYCTYYRLATFKIGSDLKDTEHSVELKVLGDQVDKSKILFARKRKDIQKKPAKYKNTDLYAGAIFILGELVK